MNGKIENNICDAIQMIVDNAVQKANYDKTVQGVVLKCVDSTIGKYKIRYQDSTFFAYSNNTNVYYPEGSDVYILIPGNNLEQEKTILGSTKKLGTNFIGDLQGKDLLSPVGINAIQSEKTFSLNSYKTEIKVLYDKQHMETNLIDVNEKDLKEYLTQSSEIRFGAEIKTNIPREQRFKGNYGIVFELAFVDESSQQIVNKKYVLDVNKMIGDPYNFKRFLKQNIIFKINGKNYQYVSKIYLFTSDFNYQLETKENDIFIKNLELIGMNQLTTEESNIYSLTVVTPQGTYFKEEDPADAKLSLKAQVRIKGNTIDEKSQEISYYWFSEDLSVSTTHIAYNKYAGEGWRCLNKYNQIDNKTVEWIPGLSEYIVTKDAVAAKELKYKCVAISGQAVLSQVITIKNLSSNYNITIESDKGTKFYFDSGNPTLTCKINGKAELAENFKYVWAEVSQNNSFAFLRETVLQNYTYNNTLSKYNELLLKIKNEEVLEGQVQDQLKNYKDVLDSYNTIMRVEQNVIHKLPVNTILDQTTYKCSVYNNEQYVGTASIVLTNTLGIEGIYNLVIKNGDKAFKYSVDGISPTSLSLEKPLKLIPLSFIFYDNKGEEVSLDNVKDIKIKWKVPTSKTMLIIPDANKQGIVEGSKELSYRILEKYNKDFDNNDIELSIDYKGMKISAKTSFTFVKEGDPGTNGTDIICKIVPRSSDRDFIETPMILNGVLNYPLRENNKWFNLQLWKNGNKIFDDCQKGVSKEGKEVNIEWQILKNKYTPSIEDNSDIQIISPTLGEFKYLGYHGNDAPANIIKCSVVYNQKVYYATLPLITAKTIDNYQIKLKEDTGFNFVTYNSEGNYPQYDNSKPFELQVLKNIDGVLEDISLLEKTNAVAYNWNAQGKLYNPKTATWESYLTLEKNNDKILLRNQVDYSPIDTFNGECLNSSLECSLLDLNKNLIGSINIPIHFLLNKYGNSAINGWDGNNVSIDKNGNGVILAPQMGAGKKENDNSFTGMLMGEVKEVGQEVSDTGLVGYYKGERTLYLSSYNGYSIFGKRGPGQLILDPSAEKALLYSNNFWKQYYTNNENNNKNGLPKTTYIFDNDSKTYNNQNNNGMLIDLTTPRILFGSGNFRVDPNGFLYARGGGSIAGWGISDTKLSAGNIELRAEGSLYGGVSGNEWSISKEGLAKFNNAEIKGKITADSGTIGNWVIKDGQISNGQSTLKSDGSVAFGKLTVDTEGEITAIGGTFSDIAATGGTFTNIVATGGTFTNISATGGTFTDISATGGTFTNIVATGANVTGTISTDNLTATGGKITDIEATNLTATGGNFTDIKATNLTATKGTFTDINIEGKSKFTGTLESASGTFKGTLKAGKVSGGTVSGSTISGGSLSIGNDTYYLRMGSTWTKNPEVSGLNITGSKGLALNGNGIGECGSIQIKGEAVGPNETIYVQAWNQSGFDHYNLRFKYGILVAIDFIK